MLTLSTKREQRIHDRALTLTCSGNGSMSSSSIKCGCPRPPWSLTCLPLILTHLGDQSSCVHACLQLPCGSDGTLSSLSQNRSSLPLGEVRVEGTSKKTEAVREANAWDPWALASVVWKPLLCVCVVAQTPPGWAPAKASEPGADVSPALLRSLHEARNRLRLMGCSVAACSTEAQGIQENLSKVRGVRGAWSCWGQPAESGTLRASAPFPCLWAELPLTKSKDFGVGRTSLTHNNALR